MSNFEIEKIYWIPADAKAQANISAEEQNERLRNRNFKDPLLKKNARLVHQVNIAAAASNNEAYKKVKAAAAKCGYQIDRFYVAKEQFEEDQRDPWYAIDIRIREPRTAAFHNGYASISIWASSISNFEKVASTKTLGDYMRVSFSSFSADKGEIDELFRWQKELSDTVEFVKILKDIKLSEMPVVTSGN